MVKSMMCAHPICRRPKLTAAAFTRYCPSPAIEINLGLALSLLKIANTVVNKPVIGGVNVNLSWQLLPGDSVADKQVLLIN